MALPAYQRFESSVTRLSPYAALASCAAPSLLLVPAKLAALCLMTRGRVASGVMMFIAVKFIGTALVARIFKLTRSSLLRIAWFARLYERAIRCKARIGRWSPSRHYLLGLAPHIGVAPSTRQPPSRLPSAWSPAPPSLLVDSDPFFSVTRSVNVRASSRRDLTAA